MSIIYVCGTARQAKSSSVTGCCEYNERAKGNFMAKKKAQPKPPASNKPAAQPLIDTNAAANTAAALVAAKVAAGAAATAAKKESAAFKQMKAGLNKPSAAALGGAFAQPNKQKKSNLPFGGGKQVGHNQTFGSDAARSGVPRRTAG
jgi:hypothetical protein